jgi:hypothetical protein
MMKKTVWIICILPMLAGCDHYEPRPVEMVSMNQSRPLEKEKSLESTIRMDVGSLEILGDQNRTPLYSFDLDYDKSIYTPDIQYDSPRVGTEGRFSFNLQSMHKMGMRNPEYNNRLRLAFTDAIPLNLRINTGVGQARLSLSGMRIARLELESGVGETKMSAYEPNPILCESVRLKSGVGNLETAGLGNLNFSNLDFEGGVGAASLDFSGEWKQNADIRIHVGVGEVNVRMPRELGVKVAAAKNFLSGLQLEGFAQRDSLYFSENYDKARFKIYIQVRTGIGRLKISWI